MADKETVLNLDLYKKFRSGDAPDIFHHVSFKTMNYDRMVDFYEKLFGCKPMYKSKEITFMTFDEEHHRIAIANTKPVFDNLGFIPRLVMKFKNWINRAVPTLVGLDHISYRLNPIDQWFDFYFRAKKQGLEPYWTINHGWISGIYYRDPDGNLVEIFYEHWRNDEEFIEEVAKKGFPEEPVGTNMDIEVLHQMFKEGVPYEELVKKGNTVPEGKKPIYGIEAAMNMRKKFK